MPQMADLRPRLKASLIQGVKLPGSMETGADEPAVSFQPFPFLLSQPAG